jgi:putative SOS response-associated peptidase YedK
VSRSPADNATLTDLVPDYNVAPTTFHPVIRNSRDGAVRDLLLMRWGLVPCFAKRVADFKGFSTFNAKAETVTTQPTWREPFKRGRRCLVPADGYFEWVALGPKEKQPYAFTVGEKSTFAFAGLWDAWHDKMTGDWLQPFPADEMRVRPVSRDVGNVKNNHPELLNDCRGLQSKTFGTAIRAISGRN